MAGINSILQTFEGLGEGDRAETIKVLSDMMREGTPRQPAKKKVNGFMGYRCKNRDIIAFKISES